MSIKLIDGWKSLWRAWSMRLAALGVVMPEIMQIIADNTAYLPWLDVDWKNMIRTGFLIGVVLARPIKQVALDPKETP